MKVPEKTLFLIVDSGISIRNILRTRVLESLREDDRLRIVIFSPLTDAAFRSEFESDRVRVEPLPERRPNPIRKMTNSLRKELLAEREGAYDTFRLKREKKQNWLARKTARLLRKIVCGSDGVSADAAMTMADAPLDAGADTGSRGDDRLDILFGLLNRVETLMVPALERKLLDRYRPDLIFFSSLYTKFYSLGIAARRRGVPVMSFMQSWDNPTSKGPFPIVPDRMIVWNEIIRNEVVRYHRYPAERIQISGVPQFDIYLDMERFADRNAFFGKWRLDSDKKLITYTTCSHAIFPDEHRIVQMLYDRMRAGAFPFRAQMLVRLHPNDHYGLYDIFEGLPDIVIQKPGRAAATIDHWDPDKTDMRGLAELMRYSDVVINIASTTTIDAACLDTPVINIGFDGPEKKPYLESCIRYYRYTHYRNIVETGGVRIAESIEDLVALITAYMAAPEMDAEGRARIRREQCWRLDGRSGERIAGYIRDYLFE